MIPNELEMIQEQYVNTVENELKSKLLKRSVNENPIQRLQENLVIWNDILTIYINKTACEFVDELNSDRFRSFTSTEKETANKAFREKIKNLILEYNKKFI